MFAYELSGFGFECSCSPEAKDRPNLNSIMMNLQPFKCFQNFHSLQGSDEILAKKPWESCSTIYLIKCIAWYTKISEKSIINLFSN